MVQSPQKGVANTVRTEEIARYEQVFLIPHCFQETFTAER